MIETNMSARVLTSYKVYGDIQGLNLVKKYAKDVNFDYQNPK